MSRSVVLDSSLRCERCLCVPRWCICEGLRPVVCPLEVDVLIHRREYWRPTSTGRLINRVMPASRGHFFRKESPTAREAVVLPGHEVWILHPLGEVLPTGMPTEKVQVILIDGSWREATAMLPGMLDWGRKVSLPMKGESRYWLRNQTEPGKYSTIEALIFLLGALGLSDAEAALRLQFDLHVYAGLRTRGDKTRADKFLATSALREVMPEVLARMEVSRPDWISLAKNRGGAAQ